jgi:dimethylhistidine N-methyltransferase
MSSATRKPPAVQHCAPDAARFRAEVLRGLRRPAKELPCKYFYDETGARLFEEICDLEEYYLTRTELAIMRRHVADMAARVGPQALLIEYGSGSGIKTRLLLDHLPAPAAYVPVDISGEQLAQSAEALAVRYPGLEVLPVCADFTRRFRLPRSTVPAARRVLYFPGSTIGNFGPAQAAVLLRRIGRLCGRGGGLLIGVDLRKDTHILEPAYDDRKGVTAAFNLNLLRRINRELGADFRLDRFRHRAFYNAEHGRIEMHLVSPEPQTVRIGSVPFSLAEGESIRTECSYKYDLAQFRVLAATAELNVEQVWTDKQGLFSVQYLAVD